jgi:hypothetical protein
VNIAEHCLDTPMLMTLSARLGDTKINEGLDRRIIAGSVLSYGFDPAVSKWLAMLKSASMARRVVLRSARDLWQVALCFLVAVGSNRLLRRQHGEACGKCFIDYQGDDL